MLLNIGIIKDGLCKKGICRNYPDYDEPFILERSEIYCGGSVFISGVLYLARGDELPEQILIQQDSALICIGTPKEIYKMSPLYLLVLDADISLEELSNEVNRIFFEYSTLEQKLQDAVQQRTQHSIYGRPDSAVL